MTKFVIQQAADHRRDEIYAYTLETWGEEQAENYIRGLFDKFQQIAHREIPWRQIPAEFEVNGYFTRYEHYYIYWKVLSDKHVGIVTILHEKMHQMERFREELSINSFD